MSKIQKNENKEKSIYRIQNWSSYNKALEQRGSLTFWISESVIENWYYKGVDKRGGQYKYSDRSIECLLGLKAVFNLPYRALVGFAKSFFALMNQGLDIPSYTQICRRCKDLEVDLGLSKKPGAIHLVADSTGLKIYGEGEWKVRRHGVSKRRTWMKLHLGLDEQDGLIWSCCLTNNQKTDADMLSDLIDDCEASIEKVSLDKGYDRKKCWKKLIEENIEVLIPPQENAVFWLDSKGVLLDHQRNKILQCIQSSSRKEWKAQSDYHRRSISETAMMRYKTIFGSYMYSREYRRQQTEAKIKVKCLNKMTLLGKPMSIKVA